jgi:hypothetical protein
MRRTCQILIPRPLSIYLWLNTKEAELVSGSVKIGPSGMPNQTILFPSIRLVHLQLAVLPTCDLGQRRDRIQKVGIIVRGSIIRRLITRSERLIDDVFTIPTLDRMVRIMGSTTDTLFTRGGWDLLEALITEAITQEMDGMGVLASSKREGISARKTGSSGISNRTIWFPRKVQKLLDNNASSGYVN